jgi:uncharacterized protein YjbI with pentapeptide repeats
MSKRKRAYGLGQATPKSTPNESSTLAKDTHDVMRKNPEEAPSISGRVADDTLKLAKRANDLEAIQKSVADASSISTGIWLSYLFVLFYFAVAAAAITHTDLLLENPVKLPFLNIELPLIAFFFLAPLIFLVVHAYTMVHFVLLAKKAVRFHHRLFEEFPGANGRNSSIRDGLRQQLPSNIFVQFLAGPSEIRDTGFGRLLKFIAWATLVFGPIALLLLLQIQFLAYHHAIITWTHRIALLTDLLIVWWLWRKILGGRADLRGWRAWKTWTKASIAIAASAATLLFSWTVATFPGEWQRAPLQWFASAEPTRINAAIFNGDVDPITRRRISWSSNTLVIPGLNLNEARKGDLKAYSIDLRGRHLEGAVFEGANFGKEADLTGAYLQGATLNGARLLGASLEHAQLQGASLVGAWLPGVSFDGARLQGASLYGADLQGASFFDADVQGTRLDNARLHGASFDSARLEATTFDHSELFGVSFKRAELIGVDLSGAKLWRSVWDAPSDEAVAGALRAAGTRWRPYMVLFPLSGGFGKYVPWSDESYASLKKEIESLPEGRKRAVVLERIAQLDCRAQNLTPCDQATLVPKVFTGAVISDADLLFLGERDDPFFKAVAAKIETLVCGDSLKGTGIHEITAKARSLSDFDVINIFRGLVKYYGLRVVGGRAQSALVARFQARDCLVSKLLTDDDKARLKEFSR